MAVGTPLHISVTSQADSGIKSSLSARPPTFYRRPQDFHRKNLGFPMGKRWGSPMKKGLR